MGGTGPASALHPHTVLPPPAPSPAPSTSAAAAAAALRGGERRGDVRYLLGAPLAFVEDVPQDEHYFGPEQPQGGLESPLHLPFPVRSDTAGQRYLLCCVYTPFSQEPAATDKGR